jgi:hypothetical protein
MNAALAIIHSMRPQSELQALLVAVQIIATGFSGLRRPPRRGSPVRGQAQPPRAAVVLIYDNLLRSEARYHHERARGEPERGQGAIPTQLAEVPHRLDSCIAPGRIFGLRRAAGSEGGRRSDPFRCANLTVEAGYAPAGRLIPVGSRMTCTALTVATRI